jgi:protein-S-isoprenylcysteine O-methyltransferase Ste14
LTLKILTFTAIVPGSIIGWIPWLIVRSRPRPLVDWMRFETWCGVALLLVGTSIYAHCAWYFGSRGRGTPAPVAPPRELVVSGLYRVVRNPMYVGVLLALIGDALTYRSSSVAIYAASMTAVFHGFVVGYEEPKLRRVFGPSFASYCESVPRWGFWLRPGRAIEN